MRRAEGFSLAETLIAIVLLGLVAIGFMKFSYPRASFYQANTANLIAEKVIEDCRNSSFSSLSSSTKTETVNDVNYTCVITVEKFDISTTSPSGNYTLTTGTGGILKTPGTNRIAKVKVDVKNGSTTLSTRTAYIADP